MVTIFATVKIQEGRMEEAIPVLQAIATSVRESEPGVIGYIPHTVAGEGNENTIIFYEKYEDEAAMQAHLAQLKTTLADLMPLVEPGEDIKICTEII